MLPRTKITHVLTKQAHVLTKQARVLIKQAPVLIKQAHILPDLPYSALLPHSSPSLVHLFADGVHLQHLLVAMHVAQSVGAAARAMAVDNLVEVVRGEE